MIIDHLVCTVILSCSIQYKLYYRGMCSMYWFLLKHSLGNVLMCPIQQAAVIAKKYIEIYK